MNADLTRDFLPNGLFPREAATDWKDNEATVGDPNRNRTWLCEAVFSSGDLSGAACSCSLIKTKDEQVYLLLKPQ